MADLRARLAKAKRQALAFKARATEAAAARDAALAELAALQQRPQVHRQHAPSTGPPALSNLVTF